MVRDQPGSFFVEELSSQLKFRRLAVSGPASVTVAETGPDLVPDLPVDDRLMLAGIDEFPVPGLPQVDGVSENRIERTPAERPVAGNPPGSAGSVFRANAFLCQGDLQLPDAAQFQIE